MAELMVDLQLAVGKNTMALPPGWSHRGYDRPADHYGGARRACYATTAICPAHGTLCEHSGIT